VKSVLSLKHYRRMLKRIGQAEAMFQVNDSTLISNPVRKVILEEPSSGPSLLMIVLTTAGVL
jgi:hypothetical protein